MQNWKKKKKTRTFLYGLNVDKDNLYRNKEVERI